MYIVVITVLPPSEKAQENATVKTKAWMIDLIIGFNFMNSRTNETLGCDCVNFIVFALSFEYNENCV